MHFLFNIHPLDHNAVKALNTDCLRHGLSITCQYLVNGHPVDHWNEHVNGCVFYLANKRIFHANHAQARLSCDGISSEHRKTLLHIIQKQHIVRKTSLLPGLMLSLVFMIIAGLFIWAHYHVSGMIVSYLAMVALLTGLSGLLILAVTRPPLSNPDRIARTGHILYLMSVLLFVPASLLTLPLQRAIVKNRSYRIMKAN